MEFFLFFLFVGFLVFLFTLHILTREDYALMRKNISMEQLFNVAISVSVSSLFISRLVYVLLHPSKLYLNPLAFLLFPYFPGMSLIGGILGGVLTLWYMCRIKKYPFLKFLDFFALAFVPALPLLTLGTLFLHPSTYTLPIIGSVGIYAIISIVFLAYVYRKVISQEFQEGTTSSLFLLSISSLSLIQHALSQRKGVLFFLTIEDFFYIGTLVGGVILLYIMQKKNKGEKKVL